MKQFFLTTFTDPATLATTLELFPKSERRDAEIRIEHYLEALFWYIVESSLDQSDQQQLRSIVSSDDEHSLLIWFDSNQELQSAFEEACDRHLLKIRTAIQETLA